MRATSVLVLLSMVTLTAASQAADWKEIGGNDEVVVFVDTTSVRRTGNRVKTWLKWIWSKEQDIPSTYPEKKYLTEKQLQVSNCKAGTLAVAQSVRYSDSDGVQVVDSYTVPERSWHFSEAVPDTIGETIMRYACRVSAPKTR